MKAPAHPADLTWVTATPLWKGGTLDRTTMRRPALLRYSSDTFMEELLTTLASKTPEDLAQKIADRGEGETTLKLYQPVHGQFHLVTASLVCQRPGLPDHAVDTTKEEQVSFVLRRVEGTTELAWIPDGSKPGRWQAVTDKEALAQGEALIPLFPGACLDDDKHRRKLYFGLVPTSSREVFQAAVVTQASQLSDDGETVMATGDDEADAAATAPKLGSRAGARFVIRCVYRRPRCEPKEPALLSDPSAPFLIGSYMDPDAPARTIRIPMPMDVTADALMKFKRNVGFVLSNDLRKKLSKIGDGKKALKGEVDAEDGLDQGEMWIFALPIITMIAMILMMIIASLLNMIFMWLPFLKIRIPIKLKG